MLKVIANQKVNLIKEEYDYYLELEKHFGKDAFFNLFKTDNDGNITAVLPSSAQSTAMILIFYFLNLMMNQRVRKMESILAALEERVTKIEEKK